VVARTTAKLKDAALNFASDEFSICTLLAVVDFVNTQGGIPAREYIWEGISGRSHIWALRIPREESRGRSKIGEEFQDDHTDKTELSPSSIVFVQSAKSDCKR
jgi:hypothetical protein